MHVKSYPSAVKMRQQQEAATYEKSKRQKILSMWKKRCRTAITMQQPESVGYIKKNVQAAEKICILSFDRILLFFVSMNIELL